MYSKDYKVEVGRQVVDYFIVGILSCGPSIAISSDFTREEESEDFM